MAVIENNGRELIIVLGHEESLEHVAREVFTEVLNFKYTSTPIPSRIGVKYQTTLGTTRVAYKTRDWDSEEAVCADLM